MKDYKCRICKKLLDSYQTYEYRGYYSCEICFDKLTNFVDDMRGNVIRITEASIKSQRIGAFNNGCVDNIQADGLPAVKIKEPQILKDYEKGDL